MQKKKLVLINPPTSCKGLAPTFFRFPPLGLGMVAACTPDNWEVVIRDANFVEIKTEPCDLAGITAMTSQANNAYKIAQEFRNASIPVIMGGIHPTMCSEEALQYADCVVKGEIELIWKKIIMDFENDELEKIYVNDQFHDLKGLPPAAHLLFDKRYLFGIIQTTRGCPMNCEFCSVTAFNGAKYRKRPVNEILDELEKIPQKYIFFSDDNVVGTSKEDIEHFIDLTKGIIKRKIRKIWLSQASVNIAKYDEVMHLARKAGCRGLLIGIESPSETVLKGHMKKNINVNYILKGDFIKQIHKHGIAIMGTFIMGNDEDKPECFEQVLNYIKKAKVDVPSLTFLTPFPGTRLWKRLEKEGRIPYKNFPEDWDNCNGTDQSLLDTKFLTKNRLNDGTRWIIKKTYSIFQMIKRSFHAFLYSKGNLLTAIILFQANLAWRYLSRTSVYYKNKAGKGNADTKKTPPAAKSRGCNNC
ncbi:MAG: B12-binding domain-containing radical SAM protein [Spirochaetales bacterium]|nr:B12-binding domain-containing radical SAM protein [Spirochaetales bacterium]